MLLANMKAASRLPTGIINTNHLLHPPAPSRLAVSMTYNVMTPSLIRAAEVLLVPPRFNFSSAAVESSGPETTEPSTSKPHKNSEKAEQVSKPTYFIQNRPIEPLFDHLWNAATRGLPFERYTPIRRGMQIRQLLQEMNNLTQSRMDRWMLSPSTYMDFAGTVFSDLRPSLDVWKNAKFDEEKKVWSLPLKVPNIFHDGDITVNIVKDKMTDAYMLRIQGKREVKTAIDKEAPADGDLNADSEVELSPMGKKKTTPQEQNAGTSKSDYKYEMHFQLPPLPTTEMSTQDAQEYYSPIKAHFNADAGVLNIEIPESIVSAKTVEDEHVQDECILSVPIEPVA